MSFCADDGEIERAFVPVENSHAGSVAEVYELMLDYPGHGGGRVGSSGQSFPARVNGTEPSQVERVFSHPQALAQSSAFLRQASLESEPYYDTAGAAQMVAERQDRRFAAVASRLAGERYGSTVSGRGNPDGFRQCNPLLSDRSGRMEQ